MDENWRDKDNPDKNPNALTYGISPNSPSSLSPVEIDKWKAKVSPTFKNYFGEKYDDLARQYHKLVNEYEVNKMVYESSVGFEPCIGKIYFLYEKRDGTKFLSLVEPEHAHWKGYIGSYRLNAQYTWEEV